MTYHQTSIYEPFTVFGADRTARWVVSCDHATNHVPADVGGGDLGLPAKDMSRHIAFDVGAAGVARGLATALDAPMIQTNFSRLVIDPNRGEDDPTVLMKLYDGSIIPANRYADAAEKERRLATHHRPYHQALAALMSSRAAPILLAIHSFTPRLNGRPMRPWHIGLLHTEDTRLSDPLADLLTQENDLCVGLNEPYGGYLAGDSVDRHASRQGHPNLLIEIRNDLIQTAKQQQAWADRLAPMLRQVQALV